MSVQRYETSDGTRWRVRWREAGGRMRSQTFASRAEARDYDIEVKAQRLRGDFLPVKRRETLGQAWDDWWRLEAPQKTEATRRSYLSVWNAHVKDRFDHHRLVDLVAEPRLFDEFREEMRTRGVGPQSQRRTLVVMSVVLGRCVHWGWIGTNPMRGVTKPRAKPQRAARPFSPLIVERIRAEILARDTLPGAANRATADAVLVALLAYAGVRPQEALALRWADVGMKQLTIDKAVSFGEEKSTKTRQSRFVLLVRPLGEDLRAWRAGSSHARDLDLVLPAADGELWSHAAWNNWRGRVWKRAVRRLAAADPELEALAASRPYDCRGSFVSLELRAGTDPLTVAKRAGHSPMVMFNHYAAVIDELEGAPRLSAEEQIAQAREAVRSLSAEKVRELVADEVTGRSPMSIALFAPRKFVRGK